MSRKKKKIIDHWRKQYDDFRRLAFSNQAAPEPVDSAIVTDVNTNSGTITFYSNPVSEIQVTGAGGGGGAFSDIWQRDNQDYWTRRSVAIQERLEQLSTQQMMYGANIIESDIESDIDLRIISPYDSWKKFDWSPEKKVKKRSNLPKWW